MLKNKRLALIGLGSQGYKHLRAALSLRREGALSRLVSCDPASSCLETDHHYLSTKELFDQETVDAIVIAVPNDLHFELAKQAMQLGIAVIKEKPVAVTVGQALELCRISQTFGVSLITCQQRYYQPVWQELRLLTQLMRSANEFSYFFTVDDDRPSWYWDLDQAGGGVWLNMGWHALQMIKWLWGDIVQVELSSNSGGQRPWSYQTEHTAFARIRCASGVRGTVLVSCVLPDCERMRITSADEVVVLEKKQISIWSKGVSEHMYLPKEHKKYRRQLEWALAQIEIGKGTVVEDTQLLLDLLSAKTSKPTVSIQGVRYPERVVCHH